MSRGRLGVQGLQVGEVAEVFEGPQVVRRADHDHLGWRRPRVAEVFEGLQVVRPKTHRGYGHLCPCCRGVRGPAGREIVTTRSRPSQHSVTLQRCSRACTGGDVTSEGRTRVAALTPSCE
jgi:hypothetical protein